MLGAADEPTALLAIEGYQIQVTNSIVRSHRWQQRSETIRKRLSLPATKAVIAQLCFVWRIGQSIRQHQNGMCILFDRYVLGRR